MGKAPKVDELYRSERLVKLLVLEKRISAANEASITFYDAPTPLGVTHPPNLVEITRSFLPSNVHRISSLQRNIVSPPNKIFSLLESRYSSSG